MSETDRQTDTTKKSTWWLTTTFNMDEILRLEDPSTYPPDVLEVHGGREMTKPTEEFPDGRLHFQGHIQLRKGVQQRMSYFKQWLPTTHFEPSKSAEATRKYAMKSDTAVGDKVVRQNALKYYSADEICTLIGSKVTDDIVLKTADRKEWYKASVNLLLRENVKLAGQLMNPSLRNFWVDTALVWIDKSRENVIESDSDGEP